MKIYKIIPVFILLVWSICFGQNNEPYKIGIDDRLSISFWQEPDLNTEVRVRDDGMIALPVIGDIQAAGLTTVALARSIVDQVKFYNPGISQATVVVTEFNSQMVMIAGAVATPGEYHYENIPNVLEVIREAGGALPEADLSGVTIIRQSDGKVDVIDVDLLKQIKDGDLSKLPKLKAKDLINVPLSPYGVTAELMSGQSFTGKNIYYIYGAVNEPGVKNLAEDIELVDAIAAAGGTTVEADLKNIRVVMKDVRYSSVLKFNFKDYSESGRPARYKLKPEDTIFIPYKSESTFLSSLPGLLFPAIATTIVTTILVNALNSSGN
jgi:polysaccharide export outer membrane protein